MQQCLRAGLLDELRLDLVPVLLGGGVRLFDRPESAGLRLEQTRVVDSPRVARLGYHLSRGRGGDPDGSTDAGGTPGGGVGGRGATRDPGMVRDARAMQIHADVLTTAREAYGRRAWTQAHELLGRADEAASLAPEDLERLAVAAYMLGRDDQQLGALARPITPTCGAAIAWAPCAPGSGSACT